MDFDSLIGKKLLFFGVDNNAFCLGMKVKGKIVRFAFEAIEDPTDGYRSMMDGLVQVPLQGHTFFRQPIATVIIIQRNGLGPTHDMNGKPLRSLTKAEEEYDDYSDDPRPGSFDGYELQDAKTGHVWLAFGTDRQDDWYPCFTFSYSPMHG